LVRVVASFGRRVVVRKGLFYRGFLEQRDAENLQHGVEIYGQCEPLASDSDQQVRADGDPNLSLDRVFRCAVEAFDP
jgi:hypothetical protein